MNLRAHRSDRFSRRPTGRHPSPLLGARRLTDELAHTPSEAIVLAGMWLTCAPLVLDHETADIAFSGFNDVIVGLTIVAIAFIRVVVPEQTAPLSLIIAALGAWLLAAPFVRGYHTAPAATANDIIVGVVVMLLAAASWRASHSESRR